MGIPGGKATLGGGLGVLVILAVALLTGTNPSDVADIVAGPSSSVDSGGQPAPPPPEDDEQAEFVAVILGDTETTWQNLMPRYDRQYELPGLVLFEQATQSACGIGQSAMGPFYCPLDRKIYIDLSFYRELDQRFGASGDFARAYVIAHEVGHHVQNLLGISGKVQSDRQRVGRAEGNDLSVRLELQADCLAGVWGARAEAERDMLESGDVEEGLRAAAAIGDDNLQRQTQGRVAPESFTHGTSEQRVRWFRRGLETGDPDQCDTFAANAL
jgi:predicted metalloprotease